ncbi:MAG: HIT family protein [Flavobacteriales bacterium]|nr:HIT family protein [Flavobacteriales bacterium]
MESVFSQIINKKIPCYFVAEDNYSIAFMDINPIALGHVLVVPKIQVDYLFDLDPEIYSALWNFSKIVAAGLKKTITCNRIGVSVIGLEVPHAHIHLVPINTVSDMDFSNKIDISSDELDNMAKAITNKI